MSTLPCNFFNFTLICPVNLFFIPIYYKSFFSESTSVFFHIFRKEQAPWSAPTAACEPEGEVVLFDFSGWTEATRWLGAGVRHQNTSKILYFDSISIFHRPPQYNLWIIFNLFSAIHNIFFHFYT